MSLGPNSLISGQNTGNFHGIRPRAGLKPVAVEFPRGGTGNHWMREQRIISAGIANPLASVSNHLYVCTCSTSGPSDLQGLTPKSDPNRHRDGDLVAEAHWSAFDP
jgi:hypothetical protein